MTDDELNTLVERAEKCPYEGGYNDDLKKAAQAVTGLRETVLDLQDVVNTYEGERQKALARAEAAEKEKHQAVEQWQSWQNKCDKAHNDAIEEAAVVIRGVIIKNGPNEFMVGEMVDNMKSQLVTAIRNLKHGEPE